ncbi:MAG: exodeoxyribonuclease VII large subunit [Myxococcales bacterium]|nr:exodeoxyribonuclease VII large subunit [Myxococcales bacterium]
MMNEPGVRVLPVRPKALTVAEFNRQVKGTIEERFPQVWIEGEIAQLKVSSMGHAYFDLKDPENDARVACCFFKGPRAKAGIDLREGMQVVVRGRASLYAPRGSFQFIVETAMISGAGSAAAALEALKKKLAAEGLFALERKRRLPKFPRVVGVVTARTGAAFADICRVLTRRWPTRVVIANTLVQGADAPAQIVAAIERIQKHPMVDVVIVGRGGGSSEDLAAFNDERVARAIASSRIPVISAVGHEVDHTVADLAADVRAATPSNAAEMAVPELRVVREELATLSKRASKATHAMVNRRRVALARVEKRLGDPRKLTEPTRQWLDESVARMATVLRGRVRKAKIVFGRAEQRLQGAHPRSRLARDRATMSALEARLRPAMQRLVAEKARQLKERSEELRPAAQRSIDSQRDALAQLAGKLHALSPLAILSRGYAVALKDGKAVVDSAEVQKGDALEVRLHKGSIAVEVK